MLICADARALPLVDGCVQCVVTSPPYWGLRSYPHERQLGLEPTPEAYVASMVQVFTEVWRVLKDDGTVWCNLGDAYCSGTAAQRNPTAIAGPNVPASWSNRCQRERIPAMGDLKPKDLIGIPWRVAFALQAAGWYLRSDIIWSKQNPMPESVTDRPTKAHEYIFLLSKSERYYYDAEAIKTKSDRAGEICGTGPKSLSRGTAQGQNVSASGNAVPGGFMISPERSNKRSVWHVATQPYSGSHFATFPEALIEPCILAGSRPGDLVLDPFIGSGTTGAVCDRLMRRWVGTDLSYHDLSKKRTAQRGLRFTQEQSA